MSNEKYMWPPKSSLTFYTGRGKLLLQSKDRRLDLSDSLMLHWQRISRTVTLGLRSESAKWRTWTEEAVSKMEQLIRYDLNLDAYTVTIKRLSKTGIPASKEFKWKLVIRPMGWYKRK